MSHEHTILVVDDDAPTRSATAELLAENGFHTWTARDGRDALRKLRKKKRPCLILLDLMMPGMTGWEFLELHRKGGRLRSVPLVLVTGWLDTDIAQARTMISKPVDPRRLLRAVRRILSEEERGRASEVRIGNSTRPLRAGSRRSRALGSMRQVRA